MVDFEIDLVSLIRDKTKKIIYPIGQSFIVLGLLLRLLSEF